jgi:hypothetical protein
MYGIPVTERSLTVEVKLTSVTNGSQFIFPDNQIIRGQEVTVYGIEVFTADQVTKTPGVNTLISSAGAQGLVLNFLDNNSINKVNQMPYYSLVAAYNSGVVREFKPFKMVLQKCFVQVTDSSNLTANQAILINLIYSTKK